LLHCLGTTLGWRGLAHRGLSVGWIVFMHLPADVFRQQKRAAPVGSALAESLDVALVSALPSLSEGSIRDTGTDRGLQARSTKQQPAHLAGGHIHVELVWSACRHCKTSAV
jgi:hypothetical protein